MTPKHNENFILGFGKGYRIFRTLLNQGRGKSGIKRWREREEDEVKDLRYRQGVWFRQGGNPGNEDVKEEEPSKRGGL